MKISKDLVIDWRVILFFLLLILLPFILLGTATKTNINKKQAAYFFLDDTTGHFIATFNEDDTLFESFPGIYSSLTFALDTIPSDTVTLIAFPDANLNIGAGPGIPVTLIFPPYPVATSPHEIKVKPVNDLLVEDWHYGNISFSVITSDPDYAGIVLEDINYLIQDNDLLPGINAVIDIDTFLTEGLTDIDIIFSLNSVPTDTVFITVDPDEQMRITGIPGEAVELIFPPNITALNIDGVNIRAVDDPIYEGLHTGNITFYISSYDVIYNSLTIDEINYSIVDNDSAPGINFSIPDLLELTEGEIVDIPVTISLNSEPTDTVFINIIPDGQLRAAGAPGEPVQVIFPPNTTALNDHIITIKVFDDPLYEGIHWGNVSIEIITDDVDYSLFNLDPFSILIHDNDLLPGIIFSDTTNLSGIEGDTSLFFSVVLASIPTSTVTINFEPDDDVDLGTGHGNIVSYKFKDDSALISRTVRVSLFDDPIVEITELSIITCSLTTSDTIYDNFIIPDIYVQINDNDGVSIIENDPAIFYIYPTVGNGIISYQINASSDNSLTVFDISGKLIAEKINVQRSGQLNLAHLPSGNYIITMGDGVKKYYSRFEIINH